MLRRTLLLALPILLASSPAASQSRQDKQSASNEGQLLLSRLLDIIDQAGIIIPGQGFKSIRIGDPASRLVELWGPPPQVNSRKEVLSYRLRQLTQIHFKLDDGLIESIVVMGQPGSLAKINNGVVFGMSQEQVLNQFELAPDKRTASLIRYNELGIELGFPRGRLAEILVYAPR